MMSMIEDQQLDSPSFLSILSYRSMKLFLVHPWKQNIEPLLTQLLRLWLLWLLNHLGVLIAIPTPLHFDSDRGIKVTHNDVFHGHAKCIEIDCHLFFPCLSW